MIIYILMVQWSLGLKKNKSRQDWVQFHFVLYLDPFKTQETLSGVEGQIWANHHNSIPTIISPRSHIHWLPDVLAGMCDFEMKRFFFSISWVVQHFFPNSMLFFPSVRKD